MPVGEDSIDIHEQDFDACCIAAHLFFGYGLVQLHSVRETSL